MTLEKLAQMRHIHGGKFIKNGEVNFEQLDALLEQGGGFVETLLLSSDECAETMNYIQEYMLNETRLGIPIFTVTGRYTARCRWLDNIPQAVAMGSTFNTELINRVGHAIAKELRAQGVKQLLTPVLDVGRDLRWGRVEECFGEDLFGISDGVCRGDGISRGGGIADD